MAEKREPTLTVLLRFQGKPKSYKVELFHATDWPGWFFRGHYGGDRRFRYRLRVNGRWYKAKADGGPTCHTTHEVRDLLWRPVADGLRKRR